MIEGAFLWRSDDPVVGDGARLVIAFDAKRKWMRLLAYGTLAIVRIIREDLAAGNASPVQLSWRRMAAQLERRRRDYRRFAAQAKAAGHPFPAIDHATIKALVQEMRRMSAPALRERRSPPAHRTHASDPSSPSS